MEIKELKHRFIILILGFFIGSFFVSCINILTSEISFYGLYKESFRNYLLAKQIISFFIFPWNIIVEFISNFLILPMHIQGLYLISKSVLLASKWLFLILLAVVYIKKHEVNLKEINTILRKEFKRRN